MNKLISFVLLLGCGVVIGYTALQLFPVQQRGGEVVISIPAGTSVRSFARELSSHKVVGNEKIFLVALRLSHAERRLQAGQYTFYVNQGIYNVLQSLSTAKAVEYSVTIPEGLIIEKTASHIASRYPIDTAVFISLCRDVQFIRSLGLETATLEGYLFPETYRFTPNTSEREIITRMVKHFKQNFESLPKTALSQKYTMHEIVTLASIVEKEAQVRSEQPHIAGVFHNRLRLRIPLGADPTIRYFLRKFSGDLRVSELKNPSPYNTRVHAGLPPGPIGSPGKDALLAAVSPLETNDLYFVAKWDGSGEHDFSQTNAQHERKKLEIRRQNELRKSKLGKDAARQD